MLMNIYQYLSAHFDKQKILIWTNLFFLFYLVIVDCLKNILKYKDYSIGIIIVFFGGGWFMLGVAGVLLGL